MSTRPTPTARNQAAAQSAQPYHYELGYTLEDNSYSVRENLTDIIERELLGPGRGEEEILPFSPRSHYLVGMIAPVKIDEKADLSVAEVFDDEADLQQEGENIIYPPLMGENAPSDTRQVQRAGGLLTAPALDTDPSQGIDDDDDDSEDRVPKQGSMLPSSMGLRFQVPTETPAVTVTASWGTYRPVPSERTTRDGKKLSDYSRTPHEVSCQLFLADLTPGVTAEYPLEDNIVLRVDRYNDQHTGRVLIEIALCNDEHAVLPIPTQKWMYQTKLVVSAGGEALFLPVRDALEAHQPETDEELQHLNLLYRNRLEFAVGRSCSATWLVKAGERRATEVSTTWLPVSETPQTEALQVDKVLLSMRQLAAASPEQLLEGLTPLVDSYRTWLAGQQAQAEELPEHLQEAAEGALEDAEVACRRLAEGIDYLAQNQQAQQAFAFMNTTMRAQRLRSQVAALRAADDHLSIRDAEAMVEARGDAAASWRVFQLAFILLQIKALTEPHTRERSGDSTAAAELLFFPTGGGKTEAYLGLAAYTFAIRRLQGTLDSSEGPLNGSDGVAVMMRYTLRLLTSQQFQRATTLMCAAELTRAENPEIWGTTPFRIGLWVGSAVSPKHFDEAKEQIVQAKSDPHRNGSQLTVLQVQRCPWCGEKIAAKDIETDDLARRVYVYCGNQLGECPFSQGGGIDEGLPMLTVDEEIYALAPAFVIATVDKFARLAREGQAAALFGYVNKYCPRHGYQHPDSQKRCGAQSHTAKGKHPKSNLLPVSRLRPPDLIIQDELHLITGALGTAVGLFESTIDVLCSWTRTDGAQVLPLVVASTATVRNAKAQIRSLYGRRTNIFPPQVLNIEDTFFSREKPVTSQSPGRRYLGISAQGVRLASAETRVAEVLLMAGKLLYNRSEEAHPGANHADAYMSLVCYFNATRELAGMSRYMSGDIFSRVTKPRPQSGFPLRYGSSAPGQLNLGELTSRISSSEIGKTLDELALEFDPDYDTTEAGIRRAELRRTNNPVASRNGKAPFDVVLATSMLQVGVDVQRLGLMLMVGQPKNTAEYIQASSRVGRDSDRPGLVVSLHNWARPRDLAHFEQFRHYHEAFYSQVEALSVTPYSQTSIERGLDGVLVSAVRVAEAAVEGGLSTEDSAGNIEDRREAVKNISQRLTSRMQRSIPSDDRTLETATTLLTNRLERWVSRKRQADDKQRSLVYDRVGNSQEKMALLRSPENTDTNPSTSNWKPPFKVANSMREVQPEINLLVSPLPHTIYTDPPQNAPQWQVPAKENTND